MKSGKQLRITMVGPMPPPLGGITVLFKQLADDLAKREDVDLTLLDISTTGRGRLGRIGLFLRTAARLVQNGVATDVLVVSARVPFDLLFSLIGWPFLKLCGGKLIIRKFAGNLDTRLLSLPGCFRWLYERVLFRADLWLLETKRLVGVFAGRMRRVEWYSNSRSERLAIDRGPDESRACRRIVYLGHVRPFKGILQLIEAAEQLGPEVSVDVYGPFMEGLSEETFRDCSRVRYRGVVKSDEVVPTLAQYDAMVLPTYATTEGYPGAILEAYCAGLPVVATACGAIPEIVDDSSGILVEPKDVDGLRDALQRLARDDELYRRLCKGAVEKRRVYSAERWAQRFVDLCKELVAGDETV